MDSIKERVLKLCDKYNVKVGALEKQANLSNGTLNKWNDDTVPNGCTLSAIADFFGVTVDYLLGREELEKDDVMELREQLRRRPEMKMLFKAADGATAEQIQAVAEMIEKWKT